MYHLFFGALKGRMGAVFMAHLRVLGWRGNAQWLLGRLQCLAMGGIMGTMGNAMTVSELTARIRDTLEPRFEQVTVEGEISNLHSAASGHVYFTLKDEGAVIQAASFNHGRDLRKAALAEGMLVRIGGRVTVYARRGNYQIICATVEEVGDGAILAMLEARKRALAAEGLFDEGRKRAIPRFVRSIALLTSLRGAAIRDFLEVTRRRNDGIDIVVAPSLVQGEEAAGQISERIDYINRHNLAEVMVITRGGGSLEDLLPFSDERVVRAVYRSRIPIVAAIGHEIDTALCELAADVRASTPSVAAELVSVEKRGVLEQLAERRGRLDRAMAERLKYLRATLAHYRPTRLREILTRMVANVRITLDNFDYRLRSVLRELLERKRGVFRSYREQLRILSPSAILERGFAIVQEWESGKVVSDGNAQRVGEALRIRVARGGLRARVTEILPGEIMPQTPKETIPQTPKESVPQTPKAEWRAEGDGAEDDGRI